MKAYSKERIKTPSKPLTKTKAKAKAKAKQRRTALVLKGEGECFCAGADIEWMQSTAHSSSIENKKDATQLFEMLSAIKQIPFPTLAIVHGKVMGGGLGLMSCCDFVLAERSTRFCFSEVRLGLVPAVISPFLLQRCPSHRLLPPILSARELNCKQAQELGLLDFFHSIEEVEREKEEILSALQAGGSQAIKEGKKWLQILPSLSEAEAKRGSIELIAKLRVSSEGQERLKAFLNKKRKKKLS